MSAAAATADAPKTGKKKFILIAGILAVVLAAAAVAAVLLLRQNAHNDDEYDEEVVEAPAKAKKDKNAAPVFLPLDAFTVNLADKNAERYAQIGVTLEIDSQEMAEKLKSYMPVIRNNVLMVLAHKTSDDLLERSGKERLAREIMRESVRPLGIELPDEDEEAQVEEGPARKKRKKAPYNPVRQVLFSSFIIQ
ncbi:MAG TPA: flagellar basal body-associated FliL family protein [Burkholderiaceae bacterium]|nr:flagellar basal body-associated FliL family protein [Burkholderiaceae bacterium]